MTDETLDLAVHAAGLERLRLKLEEQIHSYDAEIKGVNSDVARWRMVSELEAVSWAEGQLREKTTMAELVDVLRGLLAAAEETMAGHPFNSRYHDTCGPDCPIFRARALLRIPIPKRNP
jgi:hypothetical protein